MRAAPCSVAPRTTESANEPLQNVRNYISVSTAGFSGDWKLPAGIHILLFLHGAPVCSQTTATSTVHSTRCPTQTRQPCGHSALDFGWKINKGRMALEKNSATYGRNGLQHTSYPRMQRWVRWPQFCGLCWVCL